LNRLPVIARVLGGMLMVFAATFALPLGWSLAVGDGSHATFLVSGFGCLAGGLLLWLATRRNQRELEPRDGALLVVLGWLTMSLAGAVPFLLELPGMSFTDACFEAMAALTTTGATVISGIDQLPPSVNLWRHAMQWYGGMGIIVMAVAILPMLGVGGMQLFKAEMPGPMKERKLTPRITQTAKALWLIYIGLTVACIGALRWAGLDWFDAVCHGCSAMALGGFSTRDANVASFDSAAVEAVLSVFMLVAVMNFATHFVAFRERSLRVYLHDVEVRSVLALLLGSAAGVALYLYAAGSYQTLAESLRHAVFNTVSLGTSAGYTSADYSTWPAFVPLWLLFLACVGSSAGSTGGGIKMIRTVVLLKQARRELNRLVHPRAVAPLTINGNVVENPVIFAVLGYMLLWGATQIVLTFVMLATGLDFVSAFSVVVAAVNNLGPALGVIGPSGNYAVLSDFQTWLLAFAMVAGRLELLTFFAVLMPAFWRR
jgi:trk system potassium uptake protein TrkH